ncbi:hypothetical protein PR048_015068 [Dryococelus australis]|uniref:Uncharacterized protein n=1 Tax=Dryococelus australis TaxID=614101 RepID=A0ABQ9HFY6_9NEOP|nr:hypothetical protein PR048_015068 [Dryococelus australis]
MYVVGAEIHIILYFDNCTSQNKNKYLTSMYLYAQNLDILHIPKLYHFFYEQLQTTSCETANAESDSDYWSVQSIFTFI